MKTPFEILEISNDATDAEIKKAYLQKTRQFSPEQDPEQFQNIRNAFDIIKTQSQRLKYQLFHSEVPSIDTLAEHILQTGPLQHPTKEIFTKVLLENLQK
ncbi:DnaJ domain-containing protein [Candidatus Halobeggiatoa sp. HSG11]|nr:DnaJ domain-containing protein [Candidatus Halobeggiatoa sp. HSG11]